MARLTHWKGQKTALYAAHALKQRGVSFRWFFVGDVTLGAPGYQAHLLNLVHRLRLEDEVQFLGWVEDMPAFYQKVDLLVHLPLEPEPYGLVLAEAMAAGLPIITAAGGGLEALIEDAGGFLLPPGQPQPVADILQQLATNPEERASRGIRARAVAEKTFDPQQYTRDLIAIYQSME